MSRPSFQFYPGDWQKNANLRRCSPAARGVWMDILCLLHDSEAEYGVLRWPLKDIANAASAPMPLVRELVDKGVLKGADKNAEPYVYRPKHGGKLGEPVVLVTPMDGPVWYSSRFVRDEYVRQRRGESTRFDTANQPGSRSPKGGIGERQGDGPSTSSSPSGSEPNGSGAADAPPPVDKSTEPESPKRVAWRECGNWFVANGVAEDTARAVMGLVARDYPAVAVDACLAAAKKGETPDPEAYLIATAKRLAGEQRTVPSAAASDTAEYLAQQEAQRAASLSPGSVEAKRAAMQRLGRVVA